MDETQVHVPERYRQTITDMLPISEMVLEYLRRQNKLMPCPETEAAIGSMENVCRQLTARNARYGAIR